MPLSEYEERVLAALEQQLADTPTAELVEEAGGEPRAMVRYGVVAALLGIAVVVTTFRVSELVAACAFVMFFLGCVAAYEGVRAGGMPALSRALSRFDRD